MKRLICTFAAALAVHSNAVFAVEPNTLAAEETVAAWKLLVDGRSLSGSHIIQQQGPPEAGWHVVDGALVNQKSDGRPNGSGGGLVTDAKFTDFEFRFEWSISPGGNSGIHYFVDEHRAPTKPLYKGDTGKSPVGFEYQALDDEKYPGGKRGPTHMAGALYDLFAAPQMTLKPVVKTGEAQECSVALRMLNPFHKPSASPHANDLPRIGNRHIFL
jgi:Domain of Unknown Function (DUF1080)